MRRSLFVLAVVVVVAIMTAPPIAAQPLLTPRPPPIADVGDEVLEIAEQAKQMVDWMLGEDNGNDADELLVTW